MEMQQLRYFLAAAAELNFTRAAAKCNVSQPSLTRAIGLLERELGGDLFRRERNLTHMTDLGLRMLPLLTKAVENADHAANLAKSIRSSKIVSITLGVRDGIPLEPFVGHLLALASKFAQFDFKVKRGTAEDLEQALKDGRVDVLLGPKPEMPWDRFELWSLFYSTYSLVFREDHHMAKMDVIHLADLQGSNLLHRPDCGVSTHLRAHLDMAGIALQPALEFARDEDLISYLSHSQAIAYLPTAATLRPTLVRRKLEEPEGGFQMYAVTVAGRQKGPALGLFLIQLRAADWHLATA